MDDTTLAPPRLDEIPVLADFREAQDAEPAPPHGRASARGFGTVSRADLLDRRPDALGPLLDWSQVAELRRRASELITEEGDR